MTAKELIEKLQMLDPDQVISMEYMAYYDYHLTCNFTDYFGLTGDGVLTNDEQEKWL